LRGGDEIRSNEDGLPLQAADETGKRKGKVNEKPAPNMKNRNVSYPDADETNFKEEDIAALRRWETIIFQHVNQELDYFSHRWERDPGPASGIYVRLVSEFDKREILSERLAILRTCTDEEFEKILVEGAYKLMRKKIEEQCESRFEYDQQRELDGY
jgi:hypothetical protein